MSDKNTSRDWNYHPDLPLHDPSIFKWPPRAGFLARWFARNWLAFSERVMMVLLAVALWWFVYPSISDAQSHGVGCCRPMLRISCWF